MKKLRLLLVLQLIMQSCGLTEIPSERGVAGANLEYGACTARSASRWTEDISSYSPSATFGHGDQDWLATIAGMAATETGLIIYDEGGPFVLELDSMLNPVHKFGRHGAGPGEITGGIYTPWLPRYWDFNFLGVNDNEIMIYDRFEVEVFSRTGEPIRQVHLPDDSQPWTFGLRYLQPEAGAGMIYMMDSVDFHGSRPRRLQVWRSSNQNGQAVRQLVWDYPLKWEGGSAGTSVLAREARPFWAVYAGCHVASDGSSEYLLKYDTILEKLDSILLPNWSVPDFGTHKDDAGVSFPGVNAAAPSKPLALLRWSDLTMDPDGWAWVRAWTPRDSKATKVFAISTQTGQILEMDLPAFPRAFGAPGVYFALESDTLTDEQLIVRYSR